MFNIFKLKREKEFWEGIAKGVILELFDMKQIKIKDTALGVKSIDKVEGADGKKIIYTVGNHEYEFLYEQQGKKIKHLELLGINTLKGERIKI